MVNGPGVKRLFLLMLVCFHVRTSGSSSGGGVGGEDVVLFLLSSLLPTGVVPRPSHSSPPPTPEFAHPLAAAFQMDLVAKLGKSARCVCQHR